MAKVRVGLQMEENLKNYCFQKAEELGITLTGFINVAISQYKIQEEGMKAMQDMSVMKNMLEELQKISKNNNILP